MQTPYAVVAAEHERPCAAMQMTFAAHPTAVGCARACARYAVGRCWGLDHVLDEVELLVSELVTNAVKAATATTYPGLSRVQVRHLLLPASIVSQIWDPVPEPPIVKPLRPDSDSGRGLHLVDAVAARWGSFASAHGGKVVWCETAADPARCRRPTGRLPLPFPLRPGPQHRPHGATA